MPSFIKTKKYFIINDQIISFVEYTPSEQQATPQQKKGNYYINCRLESNVQNYWNMVLRPVQKQVVVKQQQKYYE